jgi:hypothetical protein
MWISGMKEVRDEDQKGQDEKKEMAEIKRLTTTTRRSRGAQRKGQLLSHQAEDSHQDTDEATEEAMERDSGRRVLMKTILLP